MDIKRQVVKFILEGSSASPEEGHSIIRLLDPDHSLLQSSDLKRIRKYLGGRLKNKDLSIQNYQIQSKTDRIETNAIDDVTKDNYTLSTSAQISIDLDRYYKILKGVANQLHSANSDRERMEIWKEASKLNDRIAYNKQLRRELEKGNKVNYSNTYFSKSDESDFDVPEKLHDLDKKYRYMMARRSKRKKKLSENLDPVEYQKVLKEWQHFEDVVNHLKNHLNERSKIS